MKQSEAIRGILDAIENRIRAAAEPGGVLSQVKSIVPGDRSAQNPQPPALWIYPHEAPVTHAHGIRERWNLKVVLVAVTRAKQTKEAGALQPAMEQATDIISDAMTALVDGRRLGLPWVHDVQKVRMQFIPARRPPAETKLTAVAGEMNIIFSLIEGG